MKTILFVLIAASLLIFSFTFTVNAEDIPAVGNSTVTVVYSTPNPTGTPSLPGGVILDPPVSIDKGVYLPLVLK